MDSFKQFIEYTASPAPGTPGTTIDPVSMKRIDTHLQQRLMPNMDPQEKAKVNMIYNPSSQLVGDFWNGMKQANYNVNQILPTLRKLQNDPRLPKISGYVNPNPQQQTAQPQQATTTPQAPIMGNR